MPDGAALLHCLGSCWAPHLVPSALLGIVSSGRCRAEGKLTCMGFIAPTAPCFFFSFLFPFFFSPNRSCHLIQNRQLDVELNYCHQALTGVTLWCSNQDRARRGHQSRLPSVHKAWNSVLSTTSACQSGACLYAALARPRQEHQKSKIRLSQPVLHEFLCQKNKRKSFSLAPAVSVLTA